MHRLFSKYSNVIFLFTPKLSDEFIFSCTIIITPKLILLQLFEARFGHGEGMDFTFIHKQLE